MRHLPIFLASALLASCSSSIEAPSSPSETQGNFALSEFADTDGDGIPDTRLPAESERTEAGKRAGFVDRDGDGLPDARGPGGR